MEKYVVLLSGGLDSVVSLFIAKNRGHIELALTFDYGQRAAANEIAAAAYFCEKLGVRHQVINISWLRDLTSTALVDQSLPLPQLKDLDDLEEGGRSAKAVWVPNRNGVFINIAASFAESLGVANIVPGFNKEEAATFPDNSEEFITAVNGSLSLSTLSKVKVVCFTSDMTKTDLIRAAKELAIPLDKLWSCYRAGTRPCGVCESCQRTQRALNS
jgi:7-cyano-7-deazaguanine synthase